ncbi:hypothetical protein GY12_09890 [Micrococcus luteus]|nr:hypothetical protein GY12_09890 [Micrococcus luteus]
MAWFAVDESYGGPAAYRRFVAAAHAAGLGVVQDVVHNHLGPSGNYLQVFGPYLGQGGTGWGDGLNLDGADSDEVRRFVLDNVRFWLEEMRVDGLRLDAVHALRDTRAVHLLEEMAALADGIAARAGRPVPLMAESDLNDPRLVLPRHAGGLGLAAAWNDDVHHALHVAATGGDPRLLRGLRPAGGGGQGHGAHLLPRRHPLHLPRPRPRPARAGRHPPTTRGWPASRTMTRWATAPAATAPRPPCPRARSRPRPPCC